MRDLSLHVLDLAQNSITAGATLVTVSIMIDESGWLTFTLADDGKGKIYKLAEKEYNIQYSCYTSDGSSQTLIYHIQNGVCDSITVSLTK